MVAGDSGYMPAGQGLLNVHMLAAAQAAAQREAAALRRAAANRNLLEVAQQAESEGDLRVASRLYQRIALSRPRTAANETAQQRLGRLQSEALTKLQSLEDKLADLGGQASSASPARGLRPIPGRSLDAGKVTAIFEELDQLILEYAGIATVETKVQERVSQLRGRPQYAAVLQEPTAAELWKLGQDYEQQQQVCCAVIAYEQAANLTHAPSARQARTRLAELQKDDAVVADTRRCRVLQLCHEHYDKAQRVKETLPDKAREYLAQIIELAPPDTTVHQAAREQIAMLR